MPNVSGNNVHVLPPHPLSAYTGDREYLDVSYVNIYGPRNLYDRDVPTNLII